MRTYSFNYCCCWCCCCCCWRTCQKGDLRGEDQSRPHHTRPEATGRGGRGSCTVTAQGGTTRERPLSSRADGGVAHTVRNSSPVAESPPTQPPQCPPADSRRGAARREAMDPAPPPGAAGRKTAHAPGTRKPRGSGQNDPRNPGHGIKRQAVTREGRQGSSLTPDLPGDRGRRGKPAREEGPEGRPGRSRQETSTGPG